ncbi:hypothetical protein D3C80_1742780 [compost metagenome]
MTSDLFLGFRTGDPQGNIRLVILQARPGTIVADQGGHQINIGNLGRLSFLGLVLTADRQQRKGQGQQHCSQSFHRDHPQHEWRLA